MNVTLLLAALPLLLVVGLLAAGTRAVTAALVGLIAVLAVGLLAFATPSAELASGFASFAPLVLEIAAILLTGIVLARLLTASGAMARISTWVLHSSPGPVAGAALVIFGVVPFVESVAGFGIGLTIGVPLLVHLGFGVRRASLLGILGMAAGAWGGLAVGIRVSSGLTGMPLTELGVTSAVLALGPIVLAVVTSCFVLRSWGQGLLYGVLGGGLLWTGTLAFNAAVGPALAWVLASAVTMGGMLLAFRLRGQRLRVDASLAAALLPYGAVTAGLLLTSAITALWPHPATEALTLPPLWLAVGCLVAGVQLYRRHPGTGTALRAGLRQWVPVGGATAGFMTMGWAFTAFGMSETLGRALAALGAWTVPVLGAIGTLLTGSVTGAQSMFATTSVSIAQTEALPVLQVLAASIAACGLANGASPARVAMAVSLAESALSSAPRSGAGSAGMDGAAGSDVAGSAGSAGSAGTDGAAGSGVTGSEHTGRDDARGGQDRGTKGGGAARSARERARSERAVVLASVSLSLAAAGLIAVHSALLI